MLVDGSYTRHPFADAVQNVLGATVEVARRNELHTFAVTPKRWVVERSFAWPGNVSKVMEKLRAETQYQLAICDLGFPGLVTP